LISPEDKEMAEFYALANQWPAIEAIGVANRQGAFLFWNHPMWLAQSPDGIARLTPMHETLIRNKMLHGIEIVNEDTFSIEAFQIALENELTIIGTSDVHDLIDWDYPIELIEHRPVTLIFANKNNQDSVKNALFDRRTVVWFKNTLVGEEKNLVLLLNSILSIKSAASVYKVTEIYCSFN
jgi:hypothetical protein